MTQKLDQETGLRNPAILEAQSADKIIWATISELVAERGWSLDQSIHELTHVRSDLASLLQARPRLPRAPAPVPPIKGGRKFNVISRVAERKARAANHPKVVKDESG